MGSRDERRIYRIDAERWAVEEQIEPPGIPWAAVSTTDELRFTIGEGPNDDRYVYRYNPKDGFSQLFACPDFTGSYLSYDGSDLYLSQWYKHRILQLDRAGNTLRAIDVGAEICGHAFVDGLLYVLRGTEQGNESWCLARLDPRKEKSEVEDLAAVPFHSRSLTHDGERFWSSHRAANQIVAFTLPG